MESNKPLAGVKVIDLGINIAGPGAAKVLADQGAEVIRVETLFGDMYRPQAAIVGVPVADDESPVYDIENANKKHISLDLKSGKGMEIFHRLLEDTDILVTNFRTEALQALGLAYEQLSTKYPRLVYGQLLGYGEKGPEADRPGYDIVSYWARTGLLMDTVAEGQIPVINVGGAGDHPTAVALAQGVTAALVRQLKTGKGDKVSVSLFHCGVYAAGTLMTLAQFRAKYPVPYNQPPVTPAVHPYKCSDGVWVMVMLFDFAKYWAAFCKTLGRPDLVDDPRCKSVLHLKLNQAEIVGILSEIIGAKPYSYWSEKWQAEDIPCEKLQHIVDLLTDEAAKVNDFIRPVTYPSGNTVYLPTTPIQFRAMGKPDFRTSTGIGAETREILLELGYTAEQIEEMKASKVIRCK